MVQAVISPLTLPSFQEQILSRRILYFVDQQVFFHCPSRLSSEWFVDSVPNFSESIQGLPLGVDPGNESPAKEFESFLLQFSRRKLTFQSDAMSAMAGITRRFSELPELQGGFFEGLPRSSFDSSLLFSCASRSFRRRRGFPSYSWTGWIGPLKYDFQEHDDRWNVKSWLGNYTWIAWFSTLPSSSSAPTPVWDPAAVDDALFSLPRYKGYPRSRKRPFQDKSGLTYPIEESKVMPTPLPADIRAREDLQYPLLQFWTFAVFYPMSLRNAANGLTDIVDEKGQRCGSMFLDGFHDLDFVHTGSPGKVFEFILLSRYEDDDIDFKIFDVDGVYEMAMSSQDVWNERLELGYYVMCIEWMAGGVAERRGIGIITSFEAISRSYAPGPVWKEIILG
jgi:hypothetical protein